MTDLAVYCYRCSGTGVVASGNPGAGQPCRLCNEQGIIGVLHGASIQAAVQEALINLGVQQASGPLRTEPL